MNDKLGKVTFFAYGSLLPGERDGAMLEGQDRLGADRTQKGYRLVELGPYPALVATGDLQIEGELFAIDRMLLMKLDALKELGRLFHRLTIVLESGTEAEVYLMKEEQVRGRRRLTVGSWRDRFAPRRRF